MRTSETVTLHFDLSHCPPDAEFSLIGGGGVTHPLTSYADAPGSMDRHRSTNMALALIPDEHIHRITHFVEEASVVTDHATVRRVVYPSRDDHSLPEIAAVFVHVPTEDHRKHIAKHPASAGYTPHHEMLAGYGVAASAIDDEEHDTVREHTARVKSGPRETAKSLVFHHYEIGSTNPLVAQAVLDHVITQAEGWQDLLNYIQDNGPGTDTVWYQKTHATWVNPDTGKEEPVPANLDLKEHYKDKKNPDWPVVNGQHLIPQYDLTDEYNAKDQSGVVGAATKVVQSALRTIKNDERFNGQLWNRQEGITNKNQTNVAPAPESPKVHTNMILAAAPGLLAGDSPKAKGFGIKNATSSYGLYLYDTEMVYDDATKILSFPVKNWPSRYLSAYVQFLDSAGTPIKRADIPGWNDFDKLPETLRNTFENSDSKNYLDLISAGNAVFGVPIPPLTQKVDLSFPWPQKASSAHVLLGGLGAAQGFSDWDTDVDLPGVIGTGIFCYGLAALSMALTVYIVNPFLEGLDNDTKLAMYFIGGLVGVDAFALGIDQRDTATGKKILTKLSGTIAGIIFGVVVKKIVMAAAKNAIERVIAESVAEITADEALGEIPIAGWALKIASVAADVAGLAATTIEAASSPATYSLEIQHTMDLTVTVNPDPAHGVPPNPETGAVGRDPNWPLVGDHWIVQVRYPKGPGGSGGTTYTKAGPMPGPPHNQALVIPFPDIPAGGKIEVVAGVYSENNWLAGRWGSGWVNATPDSNDALEVGGNIKENLVPLTGTTKYSQKQRVVYSDALEHHWQVTRFAIGDPESTSGGTVEELIITLDAKAVDPALVAAFKDEGVELSQSAVITVANAAEQWAMTDPDSGVTFQINKKQIFARDKTTLFELEVQNLTNEAPLLPDVIHECGSDGHRMCQLQNLTYNNKEYMVGYAWQASGQNMPRDFGTAPDNEQMYTFQAISALGQPQDSIIEPTRGFTNPSFIAFDQFGLTPVFNLDDSKKKGNVDHFKVELNTGGPVPAGLAAEFGSFNLKLPEGARVTVVTADQRWTIGEADVDPLYDLRLVREVVEAEGGSALQKVINVFTWPVPSQDNFYLDSRSYSEASKRYFIRGVSFAPGESEFDYDTTKTWGEFRDVVIKELVVHPQGYVIGIDYDNHKLLTLRLGAEPVAEDQAPLAMPLSGLGLREGLMNKPVALTIAADGRILVLEEVNQRIQAFDVNGNPVPSFAFGQTSFQLDKAFLATLDSRNADTALIQEFQRQVLPALAPLFRENEQMAASIAALNNASVDTALSAAFVGAGYAKPDENGKPPTFTVDVTDAGTVWLVTDIASQAVYDVRSMVDEHKTEHLNVFRAFALGIEIESAGSEWLLRDTANAMTFRVTNRDKTEDKSKPDLVVQRLVATMPLRTQGQAGINHLDIAVEDKGYIYTLLTMPKDGGGVEYALDIYQPDGTPLLDQVQVGVYAAKLAVDQWRSLFTLNYEKVLGPGQRTEPSVSQWQPSTPAGQGPSA